MAEPRRKQRPAHGESREALLRAVIRIVAREGIDALTFRSVAAEAGVAYGLAPYHFGSRETMLDEALLLCMREHQGRFDSTLSSGDLENFGTGIPDLIAEERDKATFQFVMLLGSHAGPDGNERVRESYDAYVAGVAEVLAQVGLESDRATASLIYAAIDGLVLQQLVYDDPQRTAEALAILRQLLRNSPASAGGEG